jgi:hypothetical protein
VRDWVSVGASFSLDRAVIGPPAFCAVGWSTTACCHPPAESFRVCCAEAGTGAKQRAVGLRLATWHAEILGPSPTSAPVRIRSRRRVRGRRARQGELTGDGYENLS